MKKSRLTLPASAGVSLLCLLLSGCGGGISEDEARTGKGDGAGADGTGSSAAGNYSLGDISTDGPDGQLLAAGGSTLIQVEVKGTGATPAKVTFNSECAAQGKASFGDVSATPVDGVASIRYTDKGCGAKDTITASIGTSRKQLSLEIERSVVQSIVFKTAIPELISLKGTGGNETSTVTFEVQGNLGTPLSNVPVQLKLNTEVGGLCIANTATSSCSQTIAVTSDNKGLVTALVRAGSISTPVRVTATNLETNTYTVSNAPVISTGVPDQDSFSLSLSHTNPHGWEKDGSEVTLNVSLADAFNNPAPVGTAISFWTEGGTITPNCTINTEGQCSLVWRSSNPRPHDGRVTILAFTQGNESFTDLNGNGFYDYGVDKFDAFNDDLAEAFLDINMDGIRDGADEAFVDFNRNGQYDGGNGIYNGVLCVDENQQCVKTGLTIRENVELTMSSNNVGVMSISETINLEAQESMDFVIMLADINGNSMPADTKVSISTDTTASFTVHNATVPKLVTQGANAINVTVKAGSQKPFGSFQVKVESAGLVSTGSFSIN